MEPETVSGVPQLPLDFFLDNILPPSAQWHTLVENRLVDEGHIVAGQWHCASSHSTPPERERDLLSIVETILSTAQRLAPHSATCRLVVASPTPNSKQSPALDAQFEIVGTTPFPIAVPWRLESMRGPEDFNEEEMIWSCQDVLSRDPCRRFSYGITIEHDELRLWFFSRAHELVSTLFDGIAGIHNLIRVVLRLAFATPEQLGYDMTVSHFETPDRAHIRLTVGDSVYITTRLLSDHGKGSICGRATRVWEAYREDDPKRTSVALKDVWVAVDAVQEGHQLLELHEKLRGLKLHPGLPHPPERYFLTLVEHNFVQTSDGVDDDTLLMTRGATPQGLSFRCLKHYRIVFEEVGTPIHRLETLSEVMRSLADAIRALQLLHQLGLVHRDVSAGNILVVDGVGRLTDLEFMRSYRERNSSLADRCIGTPNFTSGEVATGTYRYFADSFKPGVPVNLERPPFRYNPFHDVESTFWIAAWTIFYHRRTDPRLKNFYDLHFPEHFTADTWDHRMATISWGFLSLKEPDPLAPVMNILDDARHQLHWEYAKFEGDLATQYSRSQQEVVPPLTDSPFDAIHSIFIAEYEKAALQCEDITLAFPGAPKRKATPHPSPHSPVNAVDVDVLRVDSPEPPAKKLKSISPRRPPTTRSSGGRHRARSSNTRPTRQSARLAEKKRSPTRTHATR
ncbi:hypothetical protein R3P38DRAFT_2890283 [Favolaschia claudopus]|uniref:Protein kinase domain-containing protein n=1 Tax=Favolaschia claudopus TaxID=2862362 RepID=A0AAW0CTI4_9AGAR